MCTKYVRRHIYNKQLLSMDSLYVISIFQFIIQRFRDHEWCVCTYTISRGEVQGCHETCIWRQRCEQWDTILRRIDRTRDTSRSPDSCSRNVQSLLRGLPLNFLLSCKIKFYTTSGSVNFHRSVARGRQPYRKKFTHCTSGKVESRKKHI